ncbi:MAG TPA: hypothetical protein IAA53_00745 [Candidatus Avoscillospira avicola]|uniref:Uncharacterized protein n=1 Tax=Candidatus Avoscillospira avicola TaxID=2840706 RepID=A0A9D1APY4_9FIRM|nr:hypothetical protein [Candidatus Avoscillospira avicola]
MEICNLYVSRVWLKQQKVLFLWDYTGFAAQISRAAVYSVDNIIAKSHAGRNRKMAATRLWKRGSIGASPLVQN